MIDLYSLPHKALRVAVGHAGTALAATDATRLDTDLDLVREVISEVLAHGHHEDEFIQPLLAAAAPDLHAEIAVQHRDLEARLSTLRRAIDEITCAPDAPDGLTRLHRAFHRFAAANLWHLDLEESVVMPALWAAAPAGALEDVMSRFTAAHPEARELYPRWPHGLNAAERRLVGIV